MDVLICLAGQLVFDEPIPYGKFGIDQAYTGAGIARWIDRDLRLHQVRFLTPPQEQFQIVEHPHLDVWFTNDSGGWRMVKRPGRSGNLMPVAIPLPPA